MASDLIMDLEQIDDVADEDSVDLNPYLNSKYISEDEFNEFFDFSDHSSINILHVNRRSLKKTLATYQPCLVCYRLHFQLLQLQKQCVDSLVVNRFSLAQFIDLRILTLTCLMLLY